MKEKMSITVEGFKVMLIEKMVNQGIFRSKSHAIESALDKLLRDDKNARK